jgi:hypothetical protein
MSGSAPQGTDYTMSGTPRQVTIPAGQSSGNVTLTALIEKTQDKNRNAIMTLQPGSGYQFPATGKKKTSKAPSATVTILD